MNELIYEMMWDCKYCSQKKLLGLTHRHCANCGAPQDPAARYFPPEEEKVAVQNHPYVGADVACPACRSPMSRAVKCCTYCGSPIDKGAQVAMRADVVDAPPAPVASARKKSAVPLVLGLVGGFVALAIAGLCVLLFWKRDGAFEVTSRTWQRDIAVERFELNRRSA